MVRRIQTIKTEFRVRIGRGHGYSAGVRAAAAMFRSIEKSDGLCEACDPGWDDGSALRPQLNIVGRYVEALVSTGDQAKLEGFCAVVTGYVSVSTSCGPPDSAYMLKIMDKRLAGTRALLEAKGDDKFQSFLGAAVSVKAEASRG